MPLLVKVNTHVMVHPGRPVDVHVRFSDGHRQPAGQVGAAQSAARAHHWTL